MGQSGLRVVSSLPDGFMDCDATELANVLGGPTLINLPGAASAPLFISTLLHGNETTGFTSLQQVLGQLDLTALPRAVSILIGNVEAARSVERRLAGQPDYNRIWAAGESDEHLIARHVLDLMSNAGVSACVDIHNNTGRNPHYSIVATRERSHLSLARRFGSKIVYATYPDTSCAAAFSRLCPSITIEAGVVEDASGVEHVSRFLHDLMGAKGGESEGSGEFDLFHTVAVVKVSDGCSVGLLGEETDVELPPDVDRFNFRMIDPGTMLGLVRSDSCLRVEGTANGSNRLDYFLATDGGKLRTAKALMPAMLTTDCEIIKLDCLCYLMEQLK